MTTHQEMAIVSWFFTGVKDYKPPKYHEGRFFPWGDFHGRESFGAADRGRFLVRTVTKRSVGPPAGRPVAPRPSRDAEIAGTAPENGETAQKSGRNAP